MLDLNNVPPMEGSGGGDFELMPDGTIVRAIVSLQGGDIEMPEYGGGTFFKESQTTTAKWLPIELTIVGGPFDKRKYGRISLLMVMLVMTTACRKPRRLV